MLLRTAGPVALALLAAVLVDWSTNQRGLTPPRFRGPAGEGTVGGATVRRTIALLLLAALLWFSVFLGLGSIGLPQTGDITETPTVLLFLLHGLFLAYLIVWYELGFGWGGGEWAADTQAREVGSWKTQFGLAAPRWWVEVGLGAVLGLGAWLGVLAVLVALALMVLQFGGEEALPQQTSPAVSWIASLPWLLRLAISVSAGFCEEVFFRGYLQPRVGVTVSTGLFVLAHASYEQPFMLVGIALLSLIYAQLVRWRQNVWPAIVAHTLFDAVQLLVLVPTALRLLGENAALPVARLLGVGW